jgi:hypothetical protein
LQILQLRIKHGLPHVTAEQIQLCCLHRKLVATCSSSSKLNACTDQSVSFLLQCGMVLLPNNAYILIMYANFLIEVRKDGQGARTHLQLASKNNPSLIESYAIYACSEQLKKLKDGADGGMDMAAYLEFQRNYRWGILYRAVLDCHCAVLRT